MMSDSGQDHRAVRKNGHDKVQDSKIRELEEQLSKHEKDEFAHHEKVERELKANHDTHDTLIEMFHKGELAFTKAINALEGKVEKIMEARVGDRRAILVGWAILVLVGGLLLDAHLDKLDNITHDAHTAAQKAEEASDAINAWIPFARGWGDKLEQQDAKLEDVHEHDVDEIRQDMKELRRKQRQGE